MAGKKERVSLMNEPIVYKFPTGDKVRVKFEQRKAVIDSNGQRRYVDGKDVSWKTGTIVNARRVYTTKIDEEGNKESFFQYSYGIELDDKKTVLQWINEDKIEKAK